MIRDTTTVSEPATGVRSLRRPTLDTLGLGSVLEVFKAGRLPVSVEAAIEAVFGPAGERGVHQGQVGGGARVGGAERQVAPAQAADGQVDHGRLHAPGRAQPVAAG